jgi:uncharacterized protein YndB with AHSA1/START domain
MRLAHRVTTTATPAQVWDLLGRPRRWPEFNPFLRRVRGAPESARSGQTLLAVARFTGVGVPLDVVEAVPEQRLELFLHTAPGVRHRLVFELTPTVRGGCSVRLGVTVEGLFARAAAAPLWLADGFLVRLLVAQAERAARAARQRSRGAA